MKRTLLFTLFICLITFAASAQLGGECDGCPNQVENNDHYTQNGPIISTPVKKKKISVYPNPATNFIGLNDADDASKIIIYNVMGKEAKSFIVQKGLKYNVSELKRGMYLVQVLNAQNKVITTQRLNKS